ncbi:MAG: acyl-ACP desaturase, partial [Actinomycetota bacterium]
LEADPSNMMIGIERAVRNFAMPGTGIPNFTELAKQIAKTGIYDFKVHHEQILEPVVMRHWKVKEVSGLTPEAKQAQEDLVARVEKIGRVAARLSREPETV